MTRGTPSSTEQQLLRDLQSENPEARRKAIHAMVRSGDPHALEVLKGVYENDPDPAVRTYAQKAARHIWETTRKQKSTSTPPQTPRIRSPLSSNADPTSHAAQEQRPTRAAREVTKADTLSAQLHFNRAVSLHMNGETEKALKALTKAIDLNPELGNQKFPANLAGELTGLPTAEAVRMLSDKSLREGITPLQRPGLRTPRKQQLPVTLYLLIIAVVALIGVSFQFMRSGLLETYIHVIDRSTYGRYRESIAGSEYYLVPPSGQTPPGGWPVVVVLHGYGGNGRDMLPVADTFPREGVILVAPTFGEYQPYPGDGPIVPMRRILEDVGERYSIQERGAVLLGHSQGGTFAYRFSVYHPNLVAGVVTAGAPHFDAVQPSRYDLPYMFTWGENDGLQDLVLPASVYPLISQGYNVRYAIIQGAGHELTPYSIEQALQMAASSR